MSEPITLTPTAYVKSQFVINTPAEEMRQHLSQIVVEPEFEYVIKSNPNLMNPKWTSRNKDKVEIEILEDILVQRGVDLGSLISRMSSF